MIASQQPRLRLLLDVEKSVSDVDETTVRGRALRLGNHVYIETAREFDGVRITTGEVWSLSHAGQKLTIEDAVETAMGHDNRFLIIDRRDN